MVLGVLMPFLAATLQGLWFSMDQNTLGDKSGCLCVAPAGQPHISILGLGLGKGGLTWGHCSASLGLV